MIGRDLSGEPLWLNEPPGEQKGRVSLLGSVIRADVDSGSGGGGEDIHKHLYFHRNPFELS